MSSTQQQTAPTTAPRALDGWAALRFVINHELPTRLAKAQHVRLASLKALRRG